MGATGWLTALSNVNERIGVTSTAMSAAGSPPMYEVKLAPNPTFSAHNSFTPLGHGLIHAKTNVDVRRSQLAHLQSTVNRQSLESLKSQKAGGYLEEACSKTMVFTLSFISALNGGNLEFRPVHQSQETAEDAGVWKARYLQFFEDASKDEGTLLCEGSFWRTPVLGMRTLVQLRYYADGIADGRWMIVANMSRFMWVTLTRLLAVLLY